MENECPITPPSELRRQWIDNDDFPFVSGTCDLLSITRDRLNSVMDQAVSWGADQELEACCEWLGDAPVVYNDNDDLHPGSYLRDARRPKAPNLKEEALKQLRFLQQCGAGHRDTDKILRALEQLND